MIDFSSININVTIKPCCSYLFHLRLRTAFFLFLTYVVPLVEHEETIHGFLKIFKGSISLQIIHCLCWRCVFGVMVARNSCLRGQIETITHNKHGTCYTWSINYLFLKLFTLFWHVIIKCKRFCVFEWTLCVF